VARTQHDREHTAPTHLKLHRVQQGPCGAAQRVLPGHKAVERLLQRPGALEVQVQVQLPNAQPELRNYCTSQRSSGQLPLLKGKLREHHTALLHRVPHLYSRRQILLCKAGQLVGQPVSCTSGSGSPQQHSSPGIPGSRLLVQDIQAVPSRYWWTPRHSCTATTRATGRRSKREANRSNLDPAQIVVKDLAELLHTTPNELSGASSTWHFCQHQPGC